MNRWKLFVGFWAALGFAACSGDYEIERRGGPSPIAPMMDPQSGGGGPPDAVGTGGQAGSPEQAIAFCDALVVVRAKCQRCHGDPLKNSAPVPFLTHEDFHQQYGTSELQWWEVGVSVVEKDLMPYVALNEPPTSLMPPVEPLTSEEKATLLGWLKQGALPEGGTDCP